MTPPSLHNWGIAWDWRWQDPGPGRPVADVVIEFCTTNADVLGDPGGARLPGHALLEVERRLAPGYAESQDRHGPADGHSGCTLERTWQAANLATSIDALVGGDGAGAPADTGPVQVPASPPDAGPAADDPALRTAAARQRRRRCRATAGLPAPVRLRRLLAQRWRLRPAHRGGSDQSPAGAHREVLVHGRDRRHLGSEDARRGDPDAGRPRPADCSEANGQDRAPASSRSLGGRGEHPRQADARRHRGALDRPVAGRRHLPLRRVGTA